LGDDAVDDLVLSVNEAATNSILHGGGRGTLRMWSTPAAVWSEVSDRGWLTDPLAGRHPPGPGLEAHGLWLINQLCDLVQLRSAPGRTTVRMRVDLPPL
jgi:anti-sigma regulatory factor (Ser/Thr protein kinase)